MASTIKIKRSATTATPITLEQGELAYSGNSASDSLFIGYPGTSSVTRIGGGKYVFLHQSNTSSPGTTSSNSVIITNGNNFITELKTNKLIVGSDDATSNITSYSTFSNTTQLGNTAGGSNNEILSSWAIKNYINNNAPLLPNTYVAFGANNYANGGTSSFTFDPSTTLLSIGNSTVNTQVSQTSIVTYNANLVQLNVSNILSVGSNVVITTSNISVGNSSVNTQIQAGNVFLNGTTLVIGNTSTNTSITGTSFTTGSLATVSNNLVVSGTANVAGSVNVNGALTVSNTAALGNTIVNGFANISGDLVIHGNTQLGNNFGVDVLSISATVNTEISPSSNNSYKLGRVDLRWGEIYSNNSTSTTSTVDSLLQIDPAGSNSVYANTSAVRINVPLNTNDINVSGNLTVSGTLTTIDTTNIVVEDSLIRLARNQANSGLFTDTVDMGFYGVYGNTSQTIYTGLFRDSSANAYILFDGFNSMNGTIDNIVNAAAITVTTLQTYLNSGGLSTNSSSVSISANNTVNVNITSNSIILTTPLAATSGGTGFNTYNSGDIIVANTGNLFSKLALGAAGKILQSNGSVLLYDDLDGGTF